MKAILRKLKQGIRGTVPEHFQTLARQSLFRFKDRHFRSYVKTMNAEGIEFEFLIADPVAQSWYEGMWFSHELRFIRDHLVKTGDVVFDCGAHHGCTAILFSKWAGSPGKVVAFEPLPSNVAIIRENIHLNRLSNVIVEGKALGNQSGTVRISGESDAHVLAKTSVGIEVPVALLDDYLDLNPSVLKIDVEGFEIEVLRGAQKILSRLPKLAIEIHEDVLSKYGSSIHDLLSLLPLELYDVWIQNRDDEEPREFNSREKIRGRLHLFASPNAQNTMRRE